MWEIVALMIAEADECIIAHSIITGNDNEAKFLALGGSGENAPTRSGGSAGPRLKATLSGNGQTNSLYFIM